MNYSPTAMIALLMILSGISCRTEKEFKTHVSIIENKWYFNDQIINPGSPAEGLLMNVRMVNTTFEDRAQSKELELVMPGFNPEDNTNDFISKIPEYVASGVNAFTISLQGGYPLYEGAINTAFNSDGSLRENYLDRMERVIRACDDNNAAVIFSLFYQRQHSHYSALPGKDSIMKALENAVHWIKEKRFTNVVLEVTNEYDLSPFRNWIDGEWFMSEEGQIELMDRARQIYPELLISTSAEGNGLYHESLANTADFILIHFNVVDLEDIPVRINDLKKYNKPIVCNEDPKLGKKGAIAQALSVINGCGWGYMNNVVNQYIPFEFQGIEDDPEVYKMFKNLTTPGFQINPDLLKQTSITISYPRNGEKLRIGQNILFRIGHIYPNKSIPYTIELFENGQKTDSAYNRPLRSVTWQSQRPGVFEFKVVVKDETGKELYQSSQVEIIVEPSI